MRRSGFQVSSQAPVNVVSLGAFSTTPEEPHKVAVGNPMQQNEHPQWRSSRRDLDVGDVFVALGRSSGAALRVRGPRKNNADGESAVGNGIGTNAGLVAATMALTRRSRCRPARAF
jgi:hypothetical protein